MDRGRISKQKHQLPVEVDLPNGEKVHFRILTGRGRLDLRRGELTRVNEIIDDQSKSPAQRNIDVEEIYSSIVQRFYCHSTGELIYESVDDMLDNEPAPRIDKLYRAFMRNMFVAPEDAEKN